MRRFELLKSGEKVGEGVERYGVCWFWLGKDTGEDRPGYFDAGRGFPGVEIRFLDFPPAAHTSDAAPIYTLDNPPPNERGGKLPSEEVDELMRAKPDDINPKATSTWSFAALLAVLDRRLGPAPGKETR